MEDIIIVGAGGFGREVGMLIDVINQYSSEKNKYNLLGFVDDGIKQHTKIHEYEVLGGIDYLMNNDKKCALVLAIGNPSIKRELAAKLKNYHFPNIIHPNVSLNKKYVTIGTGCIICEGSIITCDIVIGDFVIVNLACTIGHDTVIEDFCSFMPAVNISGEVTVKEAVYIGTGAKVINQLEIGKNAIIGAGAVVSKSLPENCTAVGIPAKPIKFN